MKCKICGDNSKFNLCPKDEEFWGSYEKYLKAAHLNW